MVRLDANLLAATPSYLNPLKDRELDLRGTLYTLSSKCSSLAHETLIPNLHLPPPSSSLSSLLLTLLTTGRSQNTCYRKLGSNTRSTRFDRSHRQCSHNPLQLPPSTPTTTSPPFQQSHSFHFTIHSYKSTKSADLNSYEL